MWNLVMSPIFWIGVALVIVAIIVLSALISSKRSREVDELGTYFPDGELDNTTRISVEKVRRSTLARQQRKQASQHLPRRQPREEVLELDKQEYVQKQDEEDELELDDYGQVEEENLNLPAVQDTLTSERQFNRQQFKSNILQSRNTALTTDENFTNKRPSFAKRTPLNSNNNTTATTNASTNNSRSPLRRPMTNKTAYPSLRKDANSPTNTEDNSSPRFPNRRSKRMF